MKRLLYLAAAAVAACGHSTKAAQHEPEPPPAGDGDGAGKAEAFTIGAFSAYSLLDGVFIAPNDGQMLFPGHGAADTGPLLTAAGLPTDTITLSIHPLLVKTADRVLLFDTGTGVDPASPTTGLLGKSLALAGIAPGDVTDVFISHLHGDHIGGLAAKDGSAAFPNAAVHISAPEWDAMQKDDDAKPIVAAVAAKVVPFEPGAQILPEVHAVATPGHTVGHSCYEIVSGTDKLFYLGDVAHHSILSVQRPAWTMGFDGDKPAGQAMREGTLATLAATGERVFAVHFPFPGLGTVIKQGDGMAWTAE